MTSIILFLLMLNKCFSYKSINIMIIYKIDLLCKYQLLSSGSGGFTNLQYIYNDGESVFVYKKKFHKY